MHPTVTFSLTVMLIAGDGVKKEMGSPSSTKERRQPLNDLFDRESMKLNVTVLANECDFLRDIYIICITLTR